ncbi:MAG: rhomboid family intramembrane serine protease [Arenicellales bacterium]
MSLLALYHSQHPQTCQEFNLVLQAVDIDSNVVDYEGQYYLLVDDQVAEAAYAQLRLYVGENAPEKTITRPLISFKKGYIGAYLYGVILLLFGALQSTYAFGFNWFQSGLAHSEKILNGEWWRAVTALSLHADIGHMAGNIGLGALFGLFVAQYIGSGGAWLSILLSGALGNAINAYWHQGLHQSIGASTMVFGALGMLGVFALNARYAYAQRGIRRWLPFLSTFALLAFLGTAGERTDIYAHLSGYLSGCLIGVIWLSLKRSEHLMPPTQMKFGALSLIIIFAAWGFALF